MNIFKTTLKKDVIADIANNSTKEIRFPITKFWATRLSDEYNLDDKTFKFKKFDLLEVSSASNKDTEGETHTLEFDRTYVDGDEFVVEFKSNVENYTNDEVVIDIDTPIVNFEDIVPESIPEVYEYEIPTCDCDTEDSDVSNYIEHLSNSVVIKDEISKDYNDSTIEDKSEDYYKVIIDEILNNFYEDKHVVSTYAARVVVLPNGKVLGTNRRLPVNNDTEIYVDFDMCEKIYLDTTSVDVFADELLKILGGIRKNNFVFVRKRETGIFTDVNGRVYFGIKYATRRSIGFNRRYNVQ